LQRLASHAIAAARVKVEDAASVEASEKDGSKRNCSVGLSACAQLRRWPELAASASRAAVAAATAAVQASSAAMLVRNQADERSLLPDRPLASTATAEALPVAPPMAEAMAADNVASQLVASFPILEVSQYHSEA
jgi:hypothetical protein